MSRTSALGSTMGLDSSGRSDGKRGMAVANALGQRGSKSVTAAPWKSPMMAWRIVCEDYFWVADELDTICGHAKFGGYRTADAAQQLLVMTEGS
jgi:hypothetical protein